MKIPSRFLPIAAMILAPALVRLMPYILGALGQQDIHDVAGFLRNYSPVHALFLFGAARFAERRWAYLVPLAAMLISDVGIGLLTGDLRYSIYPTLPVVYGAYILFAWIGTQLRDRQSALAIAGTALACECAFFIVTNFAEWLSPSSAYPLTFAGLVQCFTLAIPFFNTRLISMAVYAPVLFGGMAFIEHRLGAAKRAASAASESNQRSAA